MTLPLTLVAEPSRAHDSTKERGYDPLLLSEDSMPNSGTDSDIDSSPVDDFYSQMPKATGDGLDQSTPVPDEHAAGQADSSGGQGAKLPVPPPAFPPRVQRPHGPQAGKQTLSPPYETSKGADGQPSKADYATMGGSKVIETIIAQTVRDTAVAAATALHPDDPQAASMAVADAMQSVLATRLTPSDTPGHCDFSENNST